MEAFIKISSSLVVITAQPCLQVLLEGMKHRYLKKSIRPTLIESNWHVLGQVTGVWSARAYGLHGALSILLDQCSPSSFYSRQLSFLLRTLENSGPSSWRSLERIPQGECVYCLPQVMNFGWPRKELVTQNHHILHLQTVFSKTEEKRNYLFCLKIMANKMLFLWM